MKNKISILVFSVILMLSISACNITSLYEKTQEIRVKATKYDVEKYSPEEYNTAETEYLKAETWVLDENRDKSQQKEMETALRSTNKL